MHKYSKIHLSDDAAVAGLDRLLKAEYPHEANVLAYVAVVDARQLYRSAGYPSMPEFLMGRWNLCRSSAFRRQRAARAAYEFPVVFEAIADGRLNLTAVALLSGHLRRENVEELIVAATHKTREQVEQLIADRFPQADVPFRLEHVPGPAPSSAENSPATAFITVVSAGGAPSQPQVIANKEASVPLEALAPASPPIVAPQPPAHPVVKPIAPERYALQVTISGQARASLRRAQELLGYQLRGDDVAQVLELALAALVEKLEKRKCGRADRPRRVAPPRSQDPHYIPADVKRAVCERDGNQCTYRNAAGERCPERRALEFDHIVVPDRGGKATVGNIRQRSRAHNQLEAECTFGVEFMRHKRQAAAERKKVLKTIPRRGAIP